jgi:uncharacterized YigZ family protein
MNSYMTISDNTNIEIEPIKKSRFIAHAFQVESEYDVSDRLREIKSIFSDANHHCWAYSLIKDNKFRFSDDGEPNGSAGKPILAHIRGNSLFNVLVVITRYFGGTKLGVGGLIRAYGQATKEVLAQTKILDVEPQCTMNIEYEYNETANIEMIFKRYNVVICRENYSNLISQTISINTLNKIAIINDITNITKGKAKVKILD